MSRKIAVTSILVALFSCMLSCSDLYAAADALDQSNIVSPGTISISSLVVDERFAPGQTIRAGISGVLSRVELGLYRHGTVTAPLFVDIVRTQNGQPSYAAIDRLATRSFSQSQIPLRSTFAEINAPAFTVSVDFLTNALSFNNGDLFGIVLRSNAPQLFGYSWWVADQGVNTYPAGATWSFQYATNSVLQQGGVDSHFATYVIVPEPTSGLLCLAAIFATQLTCKRRRSG